MHESLLVEDLNDASVIMVDPIRRRTMLFGARRRAVRAQCEQLREDINDVDRQLSELVRRRRTLVESLRRQHSLLTANSPQPGRRAAVDGSVQLPDLQADAVLLSGRRLRAFCLVLLERFGEQSLIELHRQLHLHGYGVQGRRPVQVLADALGYEYDHGHVRRVDRGVYELRGSVPPRLRRLFAS